MAGTLYVRILSAQNLCGNGDFDWQTMLSGAPSPYVVAHIGSQQAQTYTVANKYNPSWQKGSHCFGLVDYWSNTCSRHLEFRGVDPDQEALDLEIFSRFFLISESLGRAHVNISSFGFSSFQGDWHRITEQLQRAEGQKLRGTLTFDLRFFISPAQKIQCPSSAWRPLNRNIHALYAGMLPSADEFRELLMQLPEVFPPAIWRPSVMLPTAFQHVSPAESYVRFRYFGFIMAVEFFVTILATEFLHLTCVSLPNFLHNRRGADSSPTVLQRSDSERVARKLAEISKTEGKLLLRDAIFTVYFVFYNCFLFVLIDYAVSNGLANCVTGVVWELWVVWLTCIFLNHVANAILKYPSVYGSSIKLPHPTPIIVRSIVPLAGVQADHARDYVFTGLCFLTARCHDDSRQTLGLTLGYLSLVTIFAPLLRLYWSAYSRAEFREEIWCILESQPVTANSARSSVAHEGIRGCLKAQTFKFLATVATKVKEVVALLEDLPQSVLLIIFVITFGGNRYVWLTLSIAVVRVVGIVFVRRQLYPFFLESGIVSNVQDKLADFAQDAGVNESMFSQGSVALHVACRNGYIRSTMALLDMRADMNIRDYNNVTPLDAAAQKGELHIISLLLDAAEDLNVRTQTGRNALGLAAEHGLEGNVRTLIERGANIACPSDSEASVPLNEGSHSDDNEICRLIDSDVLRQNTQGTAALHLAALQGHPDIVRLLLDMNASANYPPGNARMLAHLATRARDQREREGAQGDNPEGSLLQRAAMNEAVDLAPLHSLLSTAVREAHPDVVKVLLDAQADVNHGDLTGATHLHHAVKPCLGVAAQEAQLHVVRVLLHARADVNRVDITGATPLQRFRYSAIYA